MSDIIKKEERVIDFPIEENRINAHPLDPLHRENPQIAVVGDALSKGYFPSREDKQFASELDYHRTVEDIKYEQEVTKRAISKDILEGTKHCNNTNKDIAVIGKDAIVSVTNKQENTSLLIEKERTTQMRMAQDAALEAMKIQESRDIYTEMVKGAAEIASRDSSQSFSLKDNSGRSVSFNRNVCK